MCDHLSPDKNLSKFKEWLDIGSLIDLRPSQEIIEVFGYLAYEVVREVCSIILIGQRRIITLI